MFIKMTVGVVVLASLGACSHSRPTSSNEGRAEQGRRQARAAQRYLREGDAIRAREEHALAWEAGYRDRLAAYSAACASARLLKTEEAIAWLDRSAELGWRNTAAWQKDPDLESLRTDDRFRELLRRATENQRLSEQRDAKVKDPELRVQLLSMLEEDQAAMTSGRPEAETRVTSIRLAEGLKKIITEKGWPGKAAVGQRAASAAFIVAQHANHDLAFQEACLTLMSAAMSAGDVDRSDVAYLIDRIARAHGRPQRYGTQLTWEAKALKPQELEDAVRVDEYRRSMGLPPLSEYIEDAADILSGK